MHNDNYNFIYNDGDWQIQEEEILKDLKPTGDKYYQVLKGYLLEASFKEKKEAILYVGWRNTRILKDLKDRHTTVEAKASDKVLTLNDKEPKILKEYLKEVVDVQS